MTLFSFVHIQDVGSGKSKEEKVAKAAKHFNCYCKTRQLSFDFDNLQYEDITEDLIGKYAHYLVHHAKKGFKEGGEGIKWQTIQGYYSAIKMALIEKYREKPIPQIFSDMRTKQMYKSMIRQSLDLHRDKVLSDPEQKGAGFYGQSEAFSMESLIAIPALVFWQNDSKSAEFWHLLQAMKYNCGRGSEVCSKVYHPTNYLYELFVQIICTNIPCKNSE